MKQLRALARKDARVIYRDRFMLWLSVYAFLLALVARIGVRFVPIDHLGLYLAPAVVLFGTVLLGTLLGFALIEEREQGTWLLLRVLPLRPLGFFSYLAATASFFSFLVSGVAAMLYGYPVADMPHFVFMLAASSLAAPLVMLILGATASNKIEGLAVNKIISATGLIPALIFVLPARWQILAAWCPWYWLYLGLLEAYAADPAELAGVHWPGYSPWTPGLIGIFLSIVGVFALARLYTRQAR